MAPATAPTPVPMSAPLPAPYPVPAPTAAPAPAPTAAPPTVPQAVTVKLSIDNPTIHAISRFVITSLLVDSTFKAEADRRRRRPRAHLGARGRASLTASDDFDVRPQVRRGAYRGIRLLPQLPIAGLREDHGPAHGGSSTDRTDDLDHSYTLAPKVLELHSPSGGRSDTAGIGEVAHLELLVRLRELPSLYDSAHRSRRPGRQQVDELVAELVRGGLVQAASQLAVRRRGSAAGHCEHIHTHGAVCPLRLVSGTAPVCSSRAPSSRRRIFRALSTDSGMSWHRMRATSGVKGWGADATGGEVAAAGSAASSRSRLAFSVSSV